MKKAFLFILGCISFVLGMIGIIMPLLPTTPFLLLSAVSFMHSSEPIYTWMTNHTPMGKYIENYLTYKAIPMKSKITSIILLWVVMIPAIIFSTDVNWIRILLFFVGVGVAVHLMALKTLTPDMVKEIDSDRA